MLTADIVHRTESEMISLDVDHVTRDADQLLNANFDLKTLSQLLQHQGPSSATFLAIANISRGSKDASVAKHAMIEHLTIVHAIVLSMVELERRAAQNADDDETMNADDDGCMPKCGTIAIEQSIDRSSNRIRVHPETMNEKVKLWVEAAKERPNEIRDYSK